MTFKHCTAVLLAAALVLTGCSGGQETSGQNAPAETGTLQTSEITVQTEEDGSQEQTECPDTPDIPDPGPSSLCVRRVDGLPEDFILGMDASSVIAEEDSGVRYFGFDGQEQDVFLTLAQAGITHIRVRVWNDPYDADGNGYGGGNNDIEKAVLIGRRAAEYGLKLIVDFHYSDFWADPGKQMVPKAWKGMEIEEKSEAVYRYTRDCLQKLKDAGALVGMVQVGNETNGALCGEKSWFGVQSVMQAGSRAVREVCPEALVAIHFANPEKAGSYEDYAWRMDYYKVDYDVFASSYYPYWHGTLENLKNVLTAVHDTYGKKVMVMETSYAYTAEDTDFNGNTVSDDGTIVKDYPFTVQGQANSVRNVIETVAQIPDGIGVCYWEGTWISVGGETREENEAIWEKYGSGWASRFSASYDPKDAGRYYGGCAVDNQAMFDAEGHPLESLRVYGLVRTGNDTEIVPDAVRDTNLEFDLNEKVVLPETVQAVMTDDSREDIPVVWNVTEEELAAMNTGGVKLYDITGDAGGMEAHCYISMVEFNYLKNSGFEDGTADPWTVEDRGGANELKAEQKKTDSLTGEWHYHFWSAAENSVDFSLQQEVRDLPSGTYKYSISIMGGDGGATDIAAYVLIDGEEVSAAPLAITAYNEWHTAEIRDVRVEEGQQLTVGIRVKCQGAGSGAWGKIDDAKLNSMVPEE